MLQYPYSVLLAEPEWGPGEATWAVAERLMARGFGVIPAQGASDLASAMADGPDIGAVLLGWNLFESEREFHAVADEIASSPAKPPLVLLSENVSERSVPESAARRADGFFWLPADSPSYVAHQVEHLVRAHAGELMSQFLTELTSGDPSRCLALPRPARGDLVPGGN